MKEYLKKYFILRRHEMKITWKKMKQNKSSYLFLAPYAILFAVFYILPVCSSICLSFTYYNILEPPKFIGLQNYINLILQDDIFLTAIKNTFLIAVITGPLGYIASFLFAWLINELPRWIRTIAVIIFYAPSIAGNVYVIFSIFFRGDAYGYVNAFLMNLGIIDAPILWLTNPDYMLPVCMIVILWMSLGTGFLSFVAGLQGVDRSQFEAGYMDGVNITTDRDMFRFIDKLRYIVGDIKDLFRNKQIFVTINNRKFPILGRVGTYHVICDITNKDIKVGDKVVFNINPKYVDSKIRREYR